MPRTLRWTGLFPGVVILALIVALSVGIMMFGQVGALRGSTIRLYAAMGEARGVIQGTEVWLAGQKIGLVTGVKFQPASVDTLRRLLIEMDVLARHREQLRGNSTAQVRAGGTLIGAQVVWLTPGTPDAPVIADGDTILGKRQGDTESMTARAALASHEFPAIIANIKLLSQQLTTAHGTLGAMGVEAGGGSLDLFRDRASSLGVQAISGSGSIGMAMRGGDIAGRLRQTMARVDSIRMVVGDSGTSLGRFQRDSTLLRSVAEVRNEVSIVRALLDESRGTAGRAVNDKAIAQELAQLESELAALMADIQRRPLRYIAF